MLAPRCFVLPAFALIVILALAQIHAGKPAAETRQAEGIHRAVDCSAQTKRLPASCAVANSDLRIVR
jgi:hypothetical protein